MIEFREDDKILDKTTGDVCKILAVLLCGYRVINLDDQSVYRIPWSQAKKLRGDKR